jgi:hypothetical protein
MAKYATIQQRQPLRVPTGWTEEDKRLVVQLESILDDIYRRFGRLALQDFESGLRRQLADDHSNVSDLIHTAEEFSVKLGKLEKATPDMLVNTSMRLDKTGIYLKGGTLDMEAGTSFRLRSGGALQIDAKDGENSYLRLGDGNFNVTQGGDVSARTGDFVEGLKVGSQPVWHAGNAVVSASKPAGHGILWIQPSVVSSVRYSMPTGPDRKYRWPGTHTFDLAANSPDVLAGGSITYTLVFPVYEIASTNTNVTVQAQLSKAGLGSVSFPAYRLARIDQWELKYIQVSVESSVNLLANADPIQVTITMTDVQSCGLTLQRGLEIALTASFANAGAEAQPCTMHWIP